MRARIVAALAGSLALAPAAFAGVASDEMISCAALGPKHPGSAADQTMGDRIIDRFRRAGLTTTIEPFHMPVWQPGTVTMTIASGPGAGTAYPAESFAYSGAGHVRAEAVDVGGGGASEYDGKDVRGKIVVLNGAYHRTVQVEEAIRHGAGAMVWISSSPSNLIQTGSVRWGQRPQSPIPAVSLGADTGAALRTQLDAGTVVLDLDVPGTRVDVVGRNIVGVRKGTTHPDRSIVVAGHYDSWYSGANDNCTAVGSLLHTVNALKDVAPQYTMVYIGWDAEETGLVGSYEWIARHQDEIGKVLLDINLEETATALFVDGQKTSMRGVLQAAGTTSSPALISAVGAAAAKNLYTPALVPMSVFRAPSGGIIPTDIEGFYSQGIQGFTTASSSPYYHTTGDTSETINLDDLESISGFFVDFVNLLQEVPPEALAIREVPTVKMETPASAAPGAEVPVDITVSDIYGQPITGEKVLVLADQRDNWAVDEHFATEMGGGKYRWILPAGVTDADVTRLRATVSNDNYIATGFTKIDQRAGGLLPPVSAARTCRSKRVLVMHVHRSLAGGVRVLRPRVRVNAGRVSVRRGARWWVLRLDLRGVPKKAIVVRIRATTTGGKTLRQKRTFQTCVPGV